MRSTFFIFLPVCAEGGLNLSLLILPSSSSFHHHPPPLYPQILFGFVAKGKGEEKKSGEERRWSLCGLGKRGGEGGGRRKASDPDTQSKKNYFLSISP